MQTAIIYIESFIFLYNALQILKETKISSENNTVKFGLEILCNYKHLI
jgi:hypothetical protein